VLKMTIELMVFQIICVLSQNMLEIRINPKFIKCAKIGEVQSKP